MDILNFGPLGIDGLLGGGADLDGSGSVIYLVVIGVLGVAIFGHWSFGFEDRNETRPRRRKSIAGLPHSFQLALAIITPPCDRESAVGCAIERFGCEVKEYGRRWAKILFLRDLVFSVAPSLWAFTRHLFKWLILGTVFERIRALFS